MICRYFVYLYSYKKRYFLIIYINYLKIEKMIMTYIYICNKMYIITLKYKILKFIYVNFVYSNMIKDCFAEENMNFILEKLIII